VTFTPVAAPPTIAATHRHAALESSSALDRVRTHVPAVSVAVACAWWLVAVPRLWGGRGGGAVTVGAILTAVAVVAVRPDRWLPARATVLAASISVAAVAVAVFAPTGWSGATTAASYVCAAWIAVVVAAGIAQDRRLVDVVMALVVMGVLVEVAESWLAWWGGESAAAPMIGTFYWHDPFAAFLVPGSLIGLSLWLRRTGAVGILGLFGLVVGSIGLVYSTSRAADACFAAGALVVIGPNLVERGLAGLRRAGAAVALTAFSVWGIAGPPFFPHRSSPFAGTAARSSGQSLGQNGGYRLDFWREALGVFERHPVTGGGYHSLATASVGHDPNGWPLSPLAHSGYLQALSDGGLLLALPFLVTVAAVCWWVLRDCGSAIRRREFSTAGFAVPVATAVMLAHSAVDFDWSYAADFTLVAILAGIVGGRHAAARSDDARPPQRSTRRTMLVSTVAVIGVGLLGLCAAAAHGGDVRQSLPISAIQGGSQ
jgi:O-antigen ligase